MWKFVSEPLVERKGCRVGILRSGRQASYADVVVGWKEDHAFRSGFCELIASAPYEAVRWETPGMTRDSAGSDFECVVLESLELVKRADGRPFDEHFHGNDSDSVVTFENLGGDAMLVVPTIGKTGMGFAHLKEFAIHASESQMHAFWMAVGHAVEKRLCDKMLWLNTSGAGVPWLHLRLDSQPKYYRWRGYVPR